MVSSQNKLEILFATDVLRWKAIILQFSGFNAEIFYSFIKQELIFWEFFPSAILGRCDLYCFQNKKSTDKIYSKYFLENCLRELKQTNKNYSLEKNRKGSILKIRNRKSNHYSRIYQGKDSLKFKY